jgi:hypothetical protein
VADLDRLRHHTSHSNNLDKRTDNNPVLVRRQGVADTLMGSRKARRLEGGSLEEEGVLHRHAHRHSLNHRRISNNVGVVCLSNQEGEGLGSIRAAEGEVRCQRPPLDLVQLYLHNIVRIFAV